jgi:hypothetical protein
VQDTRFTLASGEMTLAQATSSRLTRLPAAPATSGGCGLGPVCSLFVDHLHQERCVGGRDGPPTFAAMQR